MSINVKSTDALQLTMTKACLEVLTNLGKVGLSKGEGHVMCMVTLQLAMT